MVKLMKHLTPERCFWKAKFIESAVTNNSEDQDMQASYNITRN